MKFAAIPPITHLGDFESTGIHLCLAQVVTNKAYFAHYHERSKAGDYIILDNGAHENESFELAQLLAMAKGLGAQEVVIPDVSHNFSRTLEQFTACINYLDADPRMKDLYRDCGSPRLMFVPQVSLDGDAFTKFIDAAGFMVKQAMSVRSNELSFTIGVPLMYDAVSGGLYSILDRVTWLVEDTGIDVHLLGWSRDLNAPVDIAHDFPGVRSCDSAKPFVFAKNGIDMLRAAHTPFDDLYPGRSENYFTDEMSEQEIELGRYNLAFCVRSLESGHLPPLPEQANTM